MAERTRLLELALKGLEAERATIDDEIRQLQEELNVMNAPRMTTTRTTATKQASGKSQTRGSRLTPAGRKKLSDLMKKRWAEKRKGKTK
jgi:hypothetical protein